MIKYLSLVLFCGHVFAHHIPDDLPSESGKQYIIRYEHMMGKTGIFSEIIKTSKIHEREFKSYTLGARYRLLPSLKIGAYYSKQYGLRHDNDWVMKGYGWDWESNVDERDEDIIILELRPKKVLDFLPGGNWVGGLRTRYELNTFNDQQMIKLRPELTYIWFREGKPFMNLYSKYEIYLPLNFSEETIYKKWLYLGGLYHISKTFQVGLFYAIEKITWTTADSIHDYSPGTTYSAEEEANILGFTLNIRTF